MRRLRKFETTLAIVLFVLISASCATVAPSKASARGLDEGDAFPKVELLVGKDQAYETYLGLPEDTRTATVGDIKAEYVLVQLFSSYCPHCQAEAPDMRRLYEMIRDKGLGDKLKIVAIGVGNSAFEVDLFREKYKLPFPLFVDPDFTAYDTIGRTGTPTYYLVDLKGEPTVEYRKVGRFFGLESFFETLREKAGL